MLIANIANGCKFDCLFCSKKDRLQDGNTLKIKADYVDLLQTEIRRIKKHEPHKDGILYNTNTDSFQPVEQLLKVSHNVMSCLLEEGFNLHFSTRGVVPESFHKLMSKYANQIHAQMVLFSTDKEIVKYYEPDAPSPKQRLESIKKLKDLGVNVSARIDPLIPFITDTKSHLEELILSIRDAGIERCTTTYLVLKPKMIELFRQRLPVAHFQLIKGSAKRQAWRTVGIQQNTKILPANIRTQGYRRLKEIGSPYNVDVSVCACNNPEVGSSCMAPKSQKNKVNRMGDKVGQLDLFSVS
jgi:DNA repair photolyase